MFVLLKLEMIIIFSDRYLPTYWYENFLNLLIRKANLNLSPFSFKFFCVLECSYIAQDYLT